LFLGFLGSVHQTKAKSKASADAASSKMIHSPELIPSCPLKGLER
jgi:hypothetical protein